MTSVVWTRQSIEDVEAIRTFITRDSPKYGALIAEQLTEAVERLGKFPLSGRVVPELRQEAIREVIYGNYRIVYRVTKNEVQILTVFHASRLLNLLS